MNRLSRRHFLHITGVGALGVASLGMRYQGLLREGEIPTTVIGTSQGGVPLVTYRYGNGPKRLFLMGAQHGGPEANTAELAHNLMDFFAQNPWEIPGNITVEIMPEANPDGLVTGSRQYLSDVDPNRNWQSPDWQPDGYDSNGRFRRGLGGPYPMSEPETNAVEDYLYWYRQDFLVNYQCQGNFMFGGGEGLADDLARLYSEASGYRRPTGAGGAGGAGGVLGYRVTGAMNGWLRGQNIGACLIELATTWDPEFYRNLEGVRAVLGRLAES